MDPRSSCSATRLPLAGALAALLTMGGLAPLAAADIPVITYPDGTSVRKLSPAPSLITTGRVFIERCQVELALPGPDQEIRYTTDGTEPTATSPFDEGPFTVSATTTLRMATFARRWNFGDQHRSPVTEAIFTKQAPHEGLAAQADLVPGLTAEVYAGFWNTLPDFAARTPIATSVVTRVDLPPGVPAKGFGLRLTGYVRVPADGVYTFGLECDDAGRMWINDHLVVDNDGQHVVRTRTGEIALKSGLHRMTIAHGDGALALAPARAMARGPLRPSGLSPEPPSRRSPPRPWPGREPWPSPISCGR